MTKISRTSVGLALRAAREAAGLTIKDLAGVTALSESSLSRSENGLRDLAYTEVLTIAAALRIDAETFRQLAETFERADVAGKRDAISEVQRLAIQTAIEARALNPTA